MLHKRTDKQWADYRGNDVPRDYVPLEDRAKEAILTKVFNQAIRVNKWIADFKAMAFTESDALYAEMLKNANVVPTDRKGNYSITSFDKSVKLEVSVSERIDFDDHINMAQQKLNEYVTTKTTDIDQELSILVNQAFTSRRGRLDKSRIFGLLQLKITHPLWEEAMELIKKSISVNSSVRYMEIAEKDEEGKYNAIKLNFASI